MSYTYVGQNFKISPYGLTNLNVAGSPYTSVYTLPVGTAAGDLLVAAAVWAESGGTSTFSVDGGAISMVSPAGPVNIPTTGANTRLSALWHLVTAGDVGTGSVTLRTVVNGGICSRPLAGCVVYRGPTDFTGKFGANGGGGGGAAAQSLSAAAPSDTGALTQAPSARLITTACLVLYFEYMMDPLNGNITLELEPSGVTRRVNTYHDEGTGPTGSLVIWDKLEAAGASWPNDTFQANIIGAEPFGVGFERWYPETEQGLPIEDPIGDPGGPGGGSGGDGSPPPDNPFAPGQTTTAESRKRKVQFKELPVYLDTGLLRRLK